MSSRADLRHRAGAAHGPWLTRGCASPRAYVAVVRCDAVGTLAGVTDDTLAPDRLAALQHRVQALMPDIRADLETLTRIPSVSLDAFDQGHVEASATAVAELLRAEGLAVEVVREGGRPAAIGRGDGPARPPTPPLCAHRDVKPPRYSEGWNAAPFEPAEGDGRVYARGIAD